MKVGKRKKFNRKCVKYTFMKRQFGNYLQFSLMHNIISNIVHRAVSVRQPSFTFDGIM